MNKNIRDYQWPSSFISPSQKFEQRFINKIDKNLVNKLENFFQNYYGSYIILFPSARAGLASILRFLKIDRSKEVFVNKWVSYCIFNTLGKYTNVTTNFINPDVALAIHKWGFKQIIPKKQKVKIIEDSVDSIFLNQKDLFANKADFEIVSLPKIIGSVSGGIVVSKDINFYSFAKKQQDENLDLGKYQSKRKFEEIQKKKTFHTWLYHESDNTFMEYNSLININNNLKNYQKNKIIIHDRQQFIYSNFKNLFLKSDRLGPVLPINYNSVKNHQLMGKHFLIRQIHINKYKVNSFKKVYLLPMHFKISEKKFEFFINILRKSI